MNIKSKKSFFDFEKNDKHENFDDDESNSNANNELNANDELNVNANANNFFDDMNKNEN